MTPAKAPASGMVGHDQVGSLPAGVAIRVRYFVEVNVVLPGGRHGLAPLTSYFHTVVAAEDTSSRLRLDIPMAEVLWTNSVYQLDDVAQVEELLQVESQAAEEQREWGVQ